MESKEQLLEDLQVAELMVAQNPCRMPDGVLSALSGTIKGLLGTHFMKGASKEQVAVYLGRDVRTITRWQQQYPDFPRPRHEGHQEVSYNWLEVVRWKVKHLQTPADPPPHPSAREGSIMQ